MTNGDCARRGTMSDFVGVIDASIQIARMMILSTGGSSLWWLSAKGWRCNNWINSPNLEEYVARDSTPRCERAKRADPHYMLLQCSYRHQERSVSTMLYMASLHSITKCPFRLVDEINQGMDSRNERMIFDVLKSVTCTDGSPQFFLITPKLLPGLEFTKHMKVINIMNGP